MVNESCFLQIDFKKQWSVKIVREVLGGNRAILLVKGTHPSKVKKNLKTFRITFGHFQMSFPVHTLWLCILKLDNDIVKISKRFSRDTYQIKFFSTCKARLREKNATQPMRGKVAFTKSRRWFNWLDTWLALKICQVRFYLSIKCTRVGRRFCKLQVAKNKIHF